MMRELLELFHDRTDSHGNARIAGGHSLGQLLLRLLVQCGPPRLSCHGGVCVRLYLGLGDPHRTGILGLGTAPGLGVLKTTDGGTHWSGPVLLGASTNIRSLLVDIFDKDVVMAGTDKGLFRSTDTGASYQPVALGMVEQQVWSLAWAGGGNFVLSSKVLNDGFAIGAIGRIYYSTDQGATWAQATGYPQRPWPDYAGRRVTTSPLRVGRTQRQCGDIQINQLRSNLVAAEHRGQELHQLR